MLIKLTLGVDTSIVEPPYGHPDSPWVWSNDINGIGCDGQYLWIGANDSGIARYDGTNWYSYNLTKGNFFTDNAKVLGIDNYGNIWGLTLDIDYGKLFKWDKSNSVEIWNFDETPLQDFDHWRTLGIDCENNLWFNVNVIEPKERF